MNNSFEYIEKGTIVLNADRFPETNNSFNELFKEYERVIIETIASTFLLDTILINDRLGGNVDTIHNVRAGVEYKNKENERDYNNRGEYNSTEYHSDKRYIETNKKNKGLQERGELIDAYTGKKVGNRDRMDLDHTISANEIHNDKGRVLAGMSGADLANEESNLNVTNMSINRSKKQYSAEDFIERTENNQAKRNERILELNKKDTLSQKDKKELNKLENINKLDEEQLRKLDKDSRKKYNKNLDKTYYTSNGFLEDTMISAAKVGKSVAIRQVLGFVFTEVWIIIREDMEEVKNSMTEGFQIGEFLSGLGKSFKRAVESILSKFKDMLSKMLDGFLIGVISDIGNTIFNIFTTTAKSAGKILRQTWSGIVESVKILVFNKDDLEFGEQIKAVSKIIFTSVSVIIGSIIQVKLTKLINVPIIKDIIPTFVGALVTGLMSISLLYYIDNSQKVKELVEWCNNTPRGSNEVLKDFVKTNQKINRYAAELQSVNYESFEKEINQLHELNDLIYSTDNSYDLNVLLTEAIKMRGIELPYSNMDEMDMFMNDSTTKLVF